jgi:anti-anti-sigma factor
MHTVKPLAGPTGHLAHCTRETTMRPGEAGPLPHADARLDICISAENDRLRIVTVRGDVDLTTRSDLISALLAAVAMPDGGRVLVDLTEVTFFGADGFAALTQARHRALASGASLHTAASPDTPAGRVLDSLDWAHDPDQQESAATPATGRPPSCTNNGHDSEGERHAAQPQPD